MASTATFESLGLDYRVLRSIEKRQLKSPTAVQVAVIGKALEGKDIVAQAHTGSGKTLAYLAPAIQAVLQQEDTSAAFQVIVLVPTSELCEQARARLGLSVVIAQRAPDGILPQQCPRLVGSEGRYIDCRALWGKPPSNRVDEQHKTAVQGNLREKFGPNCGCHPRPPCRRPSQQVIVSGTASSQFEGVWLS